MEDLKTLLIAFVFFAVPATIGMGWVLIKGPFYKGYKLQSGEIVCCGQAIFDSGMTDLHKCNGGLDYISQTNVVKLGPCD